MQHMIAEYPFACDLCGNNNYTSALHSNDYRLGSATLYSLVMCNLCGLVSLHPLCQPEDLASVYPDWLWKNEVEHQRHNQDRLHQTIRLIQQCHPKTGLLLDVGCGVGNFVSIAGSKGWQARGIEVSTSQVTYAKARGLNVELCEDFLTYTPQDSFDVITFNHVLEHVPSPRAYLTHALKCLKPGGILVIAVPNYASLSRRLFGGYWTHLDLPRHLFHFTPTVLQHLLDEIGCDLLILNFANRSDNALGLRDTFWRWLRYRLLQQNLEPVVDMETDNLNVQPSGIKPIFKRAIHIASDLAAAITEKLKIADTFAVVAARKPTK